MYLRKCLVLVYGAMVIPFVGISADNVNVALHKPVIASSQQKEFPASNVTDGIISRISSAQDYLAVCTEVRIILVNQGN